MIAFSNSPFDLGNNLLFFLSKKKKLDLNIVIAREEMVVWEVIFILELLNIISGLL